MEEFSDQAGVSGDSDKASLSREMELAIELQDKEYPISEEDLEATKAGLIASAEDEETSPDHREIVLNIANDPSALRAFVETQYRRAEITERLITEGLLPPVEAL